ncbi:hypothetical protein [Amycolatopsis sp. DSM 110486]|uniref:hypothetical protein n=1 Tax=Amycolatopsis sp. DSM 110486 TaxID=2865832 RepID=UPI001C6A0DA2|nr:hypothetical protein [Amycolatopsis sp. DSM 110486]QYN17500.1 hypothetical protein K1T34_32460 [Amycolatopsis sp. DSM 110486]
MTATHVDGVLVVGDEPTVTPMKTNSGKKTVVWEQTRTLRLEDGRTVYGCQHCDYTSPNQYSVRPHLMKHNRRRPHSAHVPSAANMTLANLLETATQIDKLTTDMEAWKARALDAEDKLRALRAQTR